MSTSHLGPPITENAPPLYRRYALLTSIWIGVGLVFALQASLFDHVPMDLALRFALIDWAPWLVFSPLVLWLGDRYEINSKTWRHSLPLHLLACLLITLLGEWLFKTFFDQSLFHQIPPPDWPQDMPPPGSTEGLPEPPRHGPNGPYPLLLMIPHAKATIPIYGILVTAAQSSRHHRRSLERERRALRAEAGLTEARLAALQAQINPHFLFNTLNTIAECIRENAEAAERMVEALGEMMRAVLATSGRKLVPLREELALANCYLSIQQTRFTDRMQVRRNIIQDTLSIQVPPLLLQPLIENAVIHGLAKSKHPGLLEIHASRSDDTLLLQITNSGHGQPTPTFPLLEGTGITNIRERLQALYPGRHRMTLTPIPEGGFRATIEIPRQDSNAAETVQL